MQGSAITPLGYGDEAGTFGASNCLRAIATAVIGYDDFTMDAEALEAGESFADDRSQCFGFVEAGNNHRNLV
jgi:hypothetical protein